MIYKLPIEKSRGPWKKGKKNKAQKIIDLEYTISNLNKQLNMLDPLSPAALDVGLQLNRAEKEYTKLKILTKPINSMDAYDRWQRENDK